MAARYGRNAAIFSAAMTSAVFLGYHLIAGGIDTFYDDMWLLRFPFLFLIIGFLIGEVKTMFILREDYLTNRIQELESLNTNIKKENEIIKEAHRNLTVDVATTRDTITILNEITRRFKSIDPDNIYKGILESFKEYLNAEECSFYVREGNLLTLKESVGWKDYYRRPETYEIGKGMVGVAAQSMETISIKDVVLKKHASDAEKSNMLGDSVLAIPVVGLEDNVYGVASVEKIPLFKLTDSTIQAAKITCELAASSLNNAYSFMAMKERQIKEDEYDLYKYHYFLTRLDEEFTRSLNYMLPLSIIAFKTPMLSELPHERKEVVLKSIIELISLNTRAFDVLAEGPIREVPLILLLATTSRPQAEGLKEKLIGKIKEYKFDKSIAKGELENTIVVGSYNPNAMSKAADLLKVVGL
jgi:hypothetical protein